MICIFDLIYFNRRLLLILFSRSVYILCIVERTVQSTDKEKPEVVYQVPIIIRLCISFYEVIMSSFNTVCYLSVLLLQLQNPNVLTIILALMVFLWGALSVPRPTKRFWKVILAFTGVIMVFFTEKKR